MNRKASIIFTTTGAIAGCVLFSLAFRMVLVPLHLYSGGFLALHSSFRNYYHMLSPMSWTPKLMRPESYIGCSTFPCLRRPSIQ